MSGSATNPVLTLEVDDQISPGAAAAAASLDKLGTSADATEVRVAKLGVTAASLVNKLDPVTRAQANLTTQGDVLARGLAAGQITADQYASSMEILNQRVTAATNAHLAAAGSIEGVGNQTRATTMLIRDATGAFAELSAGMSPLQIAALHMGNLEHATETFGAVAKQAFAFVTSGPGIAIVAASAFVAIGLAAESAASRVLTLQAALQAVNSNPAASAQLANTASRDVASTGVASLADSTAAAVAFLNQPSVTQTPANIERLITDSANLAVVWGITMPDAAKKLAAAMSNPGRLAQDLANEDFKGMDDELARSIQLQADAGDKAGAYAKVLGVLEQASHDAANSSKTELQQALAGLSGVFVTADGNATSFGKTILDVASGAIDTLTATLKELKSVLDYLNSIPVPSWVTAALNSNPAALGNQAGLATNNFLFGPSTGAPSPILQFLTSGHYGNGTPSTSASIAPTLQAAAAAYGVDPALLARLQGAEGVQNADGTWQTSPAGAVGPMQVTGTTFAGIASQPGTFNALGLTNNADTTQNVTAGTALFAHLLSKYQDVNLAVLAYHDGETVVDSAIAGRGNVSQAAVTEAQKVLTGYAGNGLATAGTGTPIDVSGGAASTNANDPAKVIQDALASATAGSPAAAAATATANIKLYTTALADLAAQGVTSGKDVDVLTAALTKAQLAQFDAVGPAAKLIQTLQEQTAQQDELSAAWASGYTAEGLAVAQVKAEQQARTVAQPGTQAYADAVVRLTAAQVALAAAQQSVAAGAALADQGQQLQLLQAETATLGESAGIRAHDLAVLQEQQTIAKTMPGISQQEKDQLVAGAAAIADQNTNLQQTQAALTEVGSLATQAFDQIGSAISNSFLSGTGSAINWGNTVKAVIGTVIQEVAKLAILNPILNSITGSSNTTLLGVLGALSGSGGGSAGISTAATAASAVSGNGSILSTLSNGSTLVSGANTLSGGWLGNALGITGPNSLVSNVGGYFTGPNSALTGAYNYLFGAGTGTANAATLAVQPAGFASDAASAGTYGSSGAGVLSSNGVIANFANTGTGIGTSTIGSALGGIGAGYGLGSLAGGFEQSALDKTGPAPDIGAGVGAIAGAVIGSYIPVVGTLLGGAIGGLLGGAGGGLIGPHVATPYSSFGFNLQQTQDTGTLVPGAVLGQGENLIADQQQFAADLSTLNNILEQNNIRLTSLGGITQIGNPIAPGETDKVASVAAAIPDFRFTVGDTSTPEGQALAGQVNGVSFASADALQAAITEVDTFFNTTLPSLTAQQTNIGSLATTVNSLTAAFQPAIDEGTKLGYGVDQLTAAWDKQTTAAYAAVQAQTAGDQVGFNASYLAAAAQVSGTPQDAETASLYAFDNVTVPQAQQQLITEYQGIFGDAYATTTNYVNSSAALEASLGEQRLAIQTQYNSQIAATADQAAQAAATQQAQILATAQQAAGASVTSLLSYVQTLQGSSTSPLSAADQYKLAQSQFNAVSGAAQAGDANSIGQLPTYASALLTASRGVNGSGIGYANDYNSVLSSVSSVAALGADTLTQSFMAAAMQSQTAAIVTAIQSLQTQVAGLQTALSAANQAPARIAA